MAWIYTVEIREESIYFNWNQVYDPKMTYVVAGTIEMYMPANGDHHLAIL